MKRFGMIGAAAVIAAVAAACGSSDSTSTSESAAPGSETSTAPSTTDTTVATSESSAPEGVPQGGTMKLVAAEPLDQWDGQGYYGKQWQIEHLTMNCLLDPGYTQDAATTLVPALAADMPEVSADGTEYTFTLRDGLVYNDGSPVQASDVKAYMERVLDPAIGFDGALGSGYYSIIQGVDEFSKTDDEGKPAADRAKEIAGITVDGNAVKFKLTGPDPDFNFKMSLRFICPQKPGGPNTRTNLPEPTTGPYMLTQGDEKAIKVVRNPNWDTNAAIMGLDSMKGKLWNIDEFDITLGVTPETQLLQLKNNEADMSWTADTPTSLAERKQIEGDAALNERFQTPFDPFVRYLALKQSKPPFDNLKLRQAVNYAIDREALVKVSGDGAPWSQIIGAALPNDGKDVYPTKADVEKAKALIAESGVATPIKVKFAFGETPPGPQVAAAVKGMLEKVGFEVQLDPKPAAGYFSYISDKKNAVDIMAAGWAPDWPDGGATFSPLLSSATAGTPQNVADNKDPELDKKIAEISAMPYDQARSDAWAALSSEYAAATPPWAVWKNGEELVLMSERVGGFAYDPTHLVVMASLYLKQ